MDASNKPELLIVTGMSGAGRSTTGNALEDQGWHVIDNLPPQLLFPISDLFSTSSEALTKVAVVTDVRGGQFFADLEQNIQKLKSHDISVRVLFLEANDAALVKRFESVRRPHPLQGEGTVLDGIAAERAKLLTLRETADIVFDTSESNVHELSNRVVQSVCWISSMWSTHCWILNLTLQQKKWFLKLTAGCGQSQSLFSLTALT